MNLCKRKSIMIFDLELTHEAKVQTILYDVYWSLFSKNLITEQTLHDLSKVTAY